jgi:hypothetical protein
MKLLIVLVRLAPPLNKEFQMYINTLLLMSQLLVGIVIIVRKYIFIIYYYYNLNLTSFTK